jgi:hypothetical protein
MSFRGGWSAPLSFLFTIVLVLALDRGMRGRRGYQQSTQVKAAVNKGFSDFPCMGWLSRILMRSDIFTSRFRTKRLICRTR